MKTYESVGRKQYVASKGALTSQDIQSTIRQYEEDYKEFKSSLYSLLALVMIPTMIMLFLFIQHIKNLF